MAKKAEMMPVDLDKLQIKPLNTKTWQAFEKLFGSHGACDGCWCMWWHLKRKDFEAQRGEVNHQLIHDRVQRGDVPGLLAFLDDQAIGWAAVEPRTAYLALERSRTLKRVDDQPVWSIPCFFVAKPYRKQGVNAWLIRQAAAFAFENGAQAVEAYSLDYAKGKVSDMFIFTGTASAFSKAGFVEVARPSASRRIMRLSK